MYILMYILSQSVETLYKVFDLNFLRVIDIQFLKIFLQIILSFKMNKKLNKSNLENEKYVDKLLKLLENGDDSDIDDIEESEDEVGEDERVRREREYEEIGDSREDEILNPEPTTEGFRNKKRVRWRKQTPDVPKFEWIENDKIGDSIVLDPMQYFSKYITDEIFEQMAECTNIYALQQGLTRFKPTNVIEIETLFGLHIMIGCLNKFPRIRMYWSSVLGINVFLENMSKNRFFQLRTMLHLVNNIERPNACTDKFYKVRPIMDAVLKRCKELEIGQNISIDEQMIPFTGKINMLQYVQNKPCKWGLKIFVLCSPNGLAHNFIPYQGSTTEINRDNVKKYGQSSAIVLELLEIAKKEGHTVYFDNYFNSYALLLRLLELKMYAAGTVRMNRFYKPHFISDKDIKKKKRGYSEDLVSQDGIIMVKWLDNKPVHMASNFVGTGTIDKAKRWDKQKSAYIEIDRPEVVRQYNHNMGGVDLLDMYISLYRIYIRSRKWTLRVIMHFVDFALSNSWIEYKQDCIETKIHKKDIMDLLEFRMHVSKSLIYKNKLVNVKKRGRPSKSEGEITPDRKSKFRCCEKRPIREIQHDNVDHMPQIDDKKEATRCKMSLCKGRTHFYCDKCRVHLCLVKERNCFERFHRK